MSEGNDQFDAKSARTRQPLPLWVGAFDRATKEHTAEVIGAYMLILLAMWESKSCDLPAEEKFLAWVVKVSPTIWRRKLAPIIMPLLSEKNSRIFSEKLQKNAEKTEEYCQKQHARKTGKVSHKPLKENEATPTADQPRINHGSTTENPKQLTINIKKEEEDARENLEFSKGPASPPGLLADVREALGVVGVPGAYWTDTALQAHVTAWREGGLTDDQIITEARASRAKNPEPPDGPKALDRWMASAATAKRNAPLPGQGRAVQKAETKPPSTPFDRLKYFADWVNGSKSMPPSVISNTLAQSLLDAGLVTRDRLKQRGVYA